MHYLILAILASTLISVAMKVAERYTKNTMVMFLTNYAICSGISFYYLVSSGALERTNHTGLSFALVLGGLNGAFYLASLFFYQLSLTKNGMIITTIFMKLGVLIPTILAVVVFKETISFKQIIGIALALFASIYFNSKDQKQTTAKRSISFTLLIAMILVNGFIDSANNVYDKLGVSELKDVFLLLTFFVAFLISSVIAIVNKKGAHIKDVLFGVILGIPNYFSARFILLSLASVPAVIAYPVYNVTTIITVSLVGLIVFKERLNQRKVIGMLLIVLALALINGWL